MNKHKKLLCTAGVALLLSSTNLLATGHSARAIIDKAYAYVGSMDKYSFSAVITESEATTKTKRTVSVDIDRPNKFHVENRGDLTKRSSYFNDGNFAMMDHKFNFYGLVKTPKNIDGALDVLFEKFAIKSPLAQFMYSDMNRRAKFRKSKYFGVKDVDGVACDYVAFKNGKREIHVWVTTGDKPLVKAYSIIDKSMEPVLRTDASMVWDENPNISDSDFVFVPPKGSSEITIDDKN